MVIVFIGFGGEIYLIQFSEVMDDMVFEEC